LQYIHRNSGVCSLAVRFDINDGVVSNVEFAGGCAGNLKAIAKLVDGMRADEIAEKLKGNTCGMKATSCADQLAKAVLEAKEKEKNQK